MRGGGRELNSCSAEKQQELLTFEPALWLLQLGFLLYCNGFKRGRGEVGEGVKGKEWRNCGQDVK